jgi:hypothetical protein
MTLSLLQANPKLSPDPHPHPQTPSHWAPHSQAQSNIQRLQCLNAHTRLPCLDVHIHRSAAYAWANCCSSAQHCCRAGPLEAKLHMTKGALQRNRRLAGQPICFATSTWQQEMQRRLFMGAQRTLPAQQHSVPFDASGPA